jgi:hypothetical protein
MLVCFGVLYKPPEYDGADYCLLCACHVRQATLGWRTIPGTPRHFNGGGLFVV